MQSVEVQNDIRITDLLLYPHRIAHLVMSSFHCLFQIPFEYNVFSVHCALGRETYYSRAIGLNRSALGSNPYGPDAPRPYRLVLCAP